MEENKKQQAFACLILLAFTNVDVLSNGVQRGHSTSAYGQKITPLYRKRSSAPQEVVIEEIDTLGFSICGRH